MLASSGISIKFCLFQSIWTGKTFIELAMNYFHPFAFIVITTFENPSPSARLIQYLFASIFRRREGLKTEKLVSKETQ